MTATAETRRTDPTPAPTIHVPESPRERLKRGVPLRYKDAEVPGLGRFRLRQLRQWEKDEADAPVLQTEGDGKGNITQHFDNRGHRTRLIVFALINDDGSNVYDVHDEKSRAEGVKEVGALPREAHELLWAAFDELNPTSPEAKADLGKDSAKATS